MLSQVVTGCQVPSFAVSRKNGEYLVNKGHLQSSVVEGNVWIPLNIDTEFWSVWDNWLSGEVSNVRFKKHMDALVNAPSGRLGITTQIKGIHIDSPALIYSHDEVADLIPRHRKAKFEFHPADYLSSLGYEVTLERYEWGKTPKGLPIVHFMLYAHFALAESMMIVKNGYRDDFDTLMRANGNKPRFEMTRRLRAVTPGKRGESDHAILPWVMTINGVAYQVAVIWVDTGAMHGIAGYKDVCEAVGIKLEDKDNFTSEEKGRMLEMSIDRPEDFDAYSLGDLHPYDIYEKNAEQFGNIYKALGLTPKIPKPTIGATVRDLFLTALQDHLGADEETFKMVVKDLLEPISAGSLRMKSDRTSALLAKVVGGRCRNNRPTHTRLTASVICDLDISGCYGEGQRNQLYMVGKPEIIDYPADSKVNDYMNLKELMDGGRSKGWTGLRSELGSEGTWFGVVSTNEPLKLAQDFLSSWFLDGKSGVDLMVKFVGRMASDTELEAVDEFDEEKGTLKILNHEIHNAVITHEFLQWLDNVCSTQQRKELYEKLVVKSFVYYPESKRCSSFEDLLEVYKTWNGKNTVKRKGKGRCAYNTFEDGECHAWYGVNIGELLIDDLIANRKLYPKKTPLNTLFKLCINTLYGDMTSKFFTSANVVVGNNITARARALAWYMEKGLFGFQTITDGCAFDLNKVVNPKDGRRLTATEFVNLYRRIKDANASLTPIGSHATLGSIGKVEHIELVWVDIEGKLQAKLILHGQNGGVNEYLGNDAFDWINKVSMEHLQMLFPDIDVLHKDSTSLKPFKNPDGKAGKDYKPRKGQFEFEAKDFYTDGAFHGTANYCLSNPNGETIKFRAYETKKYHESVEMNGKGLQITGRYGSNNNPAKDFIRQLTRDPSAVKRQAVFVKQSILKVSDYKNRAATYSQKGIYPGDTYHKSGLLREFSLSQFTFKTLEQYQGWNKAIFRRKDKYGQSIEAFFTNPDGTLDYQSMVEAVDKMIDSDVSDPFKELDRHDNAFKRLEINHPHWATLQIVRQKLGGVETELELDWTESIAD